MYLLRYWLLSVRPLSSWVNGMILSVFGPQSSPHPSLPSSSSKALNTPPCVRGGSAVPVPADHTHTHECVHTCAHTPTHTHRQYAGWKTKPWALPMKTIPASALRLSCSHAVVRGGHDTAAATPACREETVSEENSHFWAIWGNIFASSGADELKCWQSAERIAGRKNHSWMLSGSLRRLRVCLPFYRLFYRLLNVKAFISVGLLL